MLRAIDLHTHSNESDGTDRPGQVITAAVTAGLGCVALTDHDTTAGWDEARAAAERSGVAFVPGIELSCRYAGGPVHILGYLIDPNASGIVDTCERIRDSREHRAERMVHALGRDYPITWTGVLAQVSDGASIGRPHIADALVAAHVVGTRDEAFRRMLHPRAGYYVPYEAPEADDAIALIRQAGGVPVIAHPGAYTRGQLIDQRAIEALADKGLMGLEVGHRENSPSVRARLHSIAQALDLIETGSSDYHGSGKPNRLGENRTAPEQLARILSAGTGAAPYLPSADSA